MKLVLDRESEIPLFLQIEQQIRYLILSGQFAPGTMLPSSRQLSQFLHVNRQTIRNALRILDKEGLIEIKQGSGIFVKTRSSQITQPSEALLHLAREAVQKARDMGYSYEDLIGAISLTGYSGIGQLVSSDDRYVVFVECNQPVLESYKNDIEKELSLKVIPYLLDEIQERKPSVLSVITGAELIITTFTHLHEVKKILKDQPVDIVGVTAGPYMDLLLSISKWKSKESVTVVMVRRQGAEEIAQSIKDAGLSVGEIVSCGLEEPDYQEVIKCAKNLVVSRAAYKTVESMLKPEQNVLVYENVLDRAGLNMLRNMLNL
ncbi:MAG: GntR family transcriptional regulator [Desulfitobacteriaceae bacterium]